MEESLEVITAVGNETDRKVSSVRLPSGKRQGMVAGIGLEAAVMSDFE